MIATINSQKQEKMKIKNKTLTIMIADHFSSIISYGRAKSITERFIVNSTLFTLFCYCCCCCCLFFHPFFFQKTNKKIINSFHFHLAKWTRFTTTIAKSRKLHFNTKNYLLFKYAISRHTLSFVTTICRFSHDKKQSF